MAGTLVNSTKRTAGLARSSLSLSSLRERDGVRGNGSLRHSALHQGGPGGSTLSILLLALTLLTSTTLASDWPQFLGPSRNGICPANDLAPSWPKDGPPVLWQMKVGAGFSGPAVTDGKLALFHRIDDKECIECLEAKTGKPLWKLEYPTAYRDDFGFDEGPRATPAIERGKVYTYGAEGVLTCADLQTGKRIWSINAKTDYAAPKGFFGIACSPLVHGNAVMLNIGGNEGAGIIAFNKDNGKVLWKSTSDPASYSSPTFAHIHGKDYAVFLTRSRLVLLDPTSGKLKLEYNVRIPIRTSVMAATPLVIDDSIFISASYSIGAALLRVGDTALEKLWGNDETLSNHYATSIHLNGFLYGIHGRTDPGFDPPPLRCVELKTGKMRWEQPGFGAATLTLAGDELLMLTERGELIRAPASPDAFRITARAQVLPNQVRAHPALADGCLYARSKDTLICLDLRK